MRKRRNDPCQLELLEWTPPAADVVVHPAVLRNVWTRELEKIVSECVANEKEIHAWLGRGVMDGLFADLKRAGATDRQAAREQDAYRSAVLCEVARRRRSVRLGPGAA